MERVKKYSPAHRVITEYIDATGTSWGTAITF